MIGTHGLKFSVRQNYPHTHTQVTTQFKQPNFKIPKYETINFRSPNPRWRVQRQTSSVVEDNGYWNNTKSLSVLAIDRREDFRIRKWICLHGFTQQFLTRVYCTGSGVVNLYQKQEREAAMLTRKQKTYSYFGWWNWWR